MFHLNNFKLPICFFFIPIAFIWIWILFNNCNIIKRKIQQTPNLLQVELKLLGKNATGYFFPFFIFIIILVYFSFSLPLNFDESYTFNNFTSKGFLHSLCKYPAPNNHVFHSLLTNVTWFCLGFTKTNLSVRLPAIFFSCLCVWFVIRFFSEKNFLISALFVSGILFCPNIFEHLFQARGYSIQIFFALTSFYFAEFASNKISFKNKLAGMLAVFTLGLFTSPAFLYSAVPVYFIFIYKHLNQIKKQIYFFVWVNIFFVASVLLLYAPIIIYQGLDKLIANPFVAPKEKLTLFSYTDHFVGLIEYFIVPYFFGSVLLLSFFVYTLITKSYYNFLIFIFPLLMMFILKQLPFYRIFVPINFLFYVISFNYLKNAIISIRKKNSILSIRHYKLIGAIVICGYIFPIIYFNNVHKKEGIEWSYQYKKIIPYFNKRVFIIDVNNCDWGFIEMSVANHAVKKLKQKVIFTNNISGKEFSSMVSISKKKLEGFAVADSIYNFKYIKRWVLIKDN